MKVTSKSSSNISQQTGFTLMELLVVVCVLAILCGLAVARFNIKDTTEAAWGAVHESAYKSAKVALTKALAEDPTSPPSLEELARGIDTKKTVYLTDCGNAENPSPTTTGGLCLGIDINGNDNHEPGEVFAAGYQESDCQNVATSGTQEVCCLERPFIDPDGTAAVSIF